MVFSNVIEIKPNQYCVYFHIVGDEIIYIGMGRSFRAFNMEGRTIGWESATKNGYSVAIYRWFEDRKEAAEAEETLIKQYKPRTNLLHNGYSATRGKTRKGVPHSKEAIQKMIYRARSSWRRQKELGLNYRRKPQPIRCIESGEMFDGMGDASRKTGVSIAGISLCVNGHRVSIKGKTFVRVEM